MNSQKGAILLHYQSFQYFEQQYQQLGGDFVTPKYCILAPVSASICSNKLKPVLFIYQNGKFWGKKIKSQVQVKT